MTEVAEQPGADQDQDPVPPARPRRTRRLLKAAVWLVVLGVIGIVVAGVLTISPEMSEELPDEVNTWENRTVDGLLVDRKYTVGVPKHPAAGRRPAIIALHGWPSERSWFIDNSDLGYLPGLRKGAVMAFPQALWRAWNSGRCCSPSNRVGVDDFAFLDAVYDELVARDDVDPERVYVIGTSAGGMMAARWACVTDRPLAGAVSVVGPPLDARGCEERATPITFVSGTADEVVPFEGGWTIPGVVAMQGRVPPFREAVESYAEAAGCRATGQVVDVATLDFPHHTTSEEFGGCPDPVRFVTMEGMGHSWPWGYEWGPTDLLLETIPDDHG